MRDINEKEHKEDEGKKKKTGSGQKKAAAVVFSIILTILPLVFLILLPMFAVSFIGDKITEFTDWVSWWGADYTLEDFKHVSGGTISYYPTETDFVDLAIKSELNQLTLNISKGHMHEGEHLTLDEAIAPFDNVYADIAVALSESFKSSYANGENAIVTNNDYYNLNKESILNQLTTAGESNDIVMWTEGQVYDEYLGIYGKNTGAALFPSNVRSIWRQGDCPEIYNLLSRWMYASFRVDETRFITDLQQQDKYGNEVNAFREEIATPGTNPLYYITRKKTSGSSDGTDSSEAGGNNCSRLVMTNTLAKKTAEFLASGVFNGETMHFGDFNGTYKDLIAETLVNKETGEIKPVIENNRGKFLSLEVLDPDEEVGGKKIPPVRYNPIVMANTNNIIGLATISDVYGNLNSTWYYDPSTLNVLTKDTLQNVSGFYVYRDNNGQDHICYAGGVYDSAQRKLPGVYGYGSYEQWNVANTNEGWRSVWNDDTGGLKAAIKSEFQKKFNEAMEAGSLESQPFVSENNARQDRIDNENRVYDASKSAAEKEYNEKLNSYTEAQNQTLTPFAENMTNMEKSYYKLVDQANHFTVYSFDQQDELDNNRDKYLELRNHILMNCCKPGVMSGQVADALNKALKYYRGETMSQYNFDIYDQAFKSYIDIIKVEDVGENINNLYIYYDNWQILLEQKRQAAESLRQYNQLLGQVNLLEQQYQASVSAYNNKLADVTRNINRQTENLKTVRDNKIKAAAEMRDRNIANIKKEPFFIKLKTKVIWYDTADSGWYGNGRNSRLLDNLEHYKQEYQLWTGAGGNHYPNIQTVTYSYGEVNTTDSSGKPNIVSFQAQYTSKDGSIKTLPANHLICYRIVYQDSLMTAPATRNNRYNFSVEKDGKGDLLHGASAKPVTDEGTLVAALDLLEEYDDMDGNPDMDPSDPDYEYASGYTLKEMLTNKTWVSPKNNWRILFELESDPIKEIDKE